MKTVAHVRRSLILLAVVVPVLSHAQPPVTFFDGGYAEMCATAAKSIDQPGSIEITGSRLGIPPLEVCNQAIVRAEGGSQIIGSSYNNRGVLHFAAGALDSALQDFDAAVRLAPALGQAHVNRGYTLIALQRWQDSIAAFTRGIELEAPELDKAYFNRGIAHEETGDARAAYYDYLKAAELNPLWEEPRHELARFTVTRNNN